MALHFRIKYKLYVDFSGLQILFGYYRDDFKAYADLCFKTFGDRVKHWSTINEPQVFGQYGYRIGLKEARTTAATDPFLATHHIILAHAAAAKLYKQTYQVSTLFIQCMLCITLFISFSLTSLWSGAAHSEGRDRYFTCHNLV